MDKKKLIPGKKYQQKRKTVISGISREAERWLKCEPVAGWAICASVPHDPAEDEEQEKYLKEWREKHKK